MDIYPQHTNIAQAQKNRDMSEFLKKVAQIDKNYPDTNIWHKVVPLHSALMENEALQKEKEELKGFVEHKEFCDAHYLGDSQCNCGLTELLNK